jgi:hypothetical protein
MTARIMPCLVDVEACLERHTAWRDACPGATGACAVLNIEATSSAITVDGEGDVRDAYAERWVKDPST